MNSRFSIAVPVGAWHDLLPANLASLRAQNVPVSVALLDASGDPRVVELADRHGDFLRYRRHGPDEGQSDAILEGWANAPGDILGWLNADDVLMPGALGLALEQFEAKSALDVVYGHSLIIDETGAMTGYHFAVEPPSARLYEAGIISQPSCFFRRKSYERAGGLDRSLHYVMDWELWIRMMKSGARFGFIDAPLSMVLWGGETKTASFNRRRREEIRSVLAAHAPEGKQGGVFRAFALHTLTERLQPPALRKAVLRRLRRGGQAIYGVGADGRLQTRAKLFLAHFSDAPKSGFSLEVDGDPRALRVASEGVALAAAARRGALDVALERPLEAGRLVVADIALASDARVFLKRCAWI
ncbi:MAG: glycosyltransferase [Alphaproteobacteria bacterium]|nr:glycosyltransferase [Alphaproteobacteria bacterium]